MNHKKKVDMPMGVTSEKRKRMSIADFKKKGLGLKLQKKTNTDDTSCSKSETPTPLPDPTPAPSSLGFSAEYAENMLRIKKSHMKMCRELRIQCRGRSHMFNYLKKNDYFVASLKKKTIVNADGKRVVVKKEPPKYPMRLTFFNGGKCHFPYSAWQDVFVARAKDIELGNLLYDNDFARSEEGIKLFFELDYRSKDNEPSDDTILEHVLCIQDVVKKFFASNPEVDFSIWILLSTPKPKYVATEMHPIIAMGCHIVFKNIVINCEQGLQLCHSANLKLESEYGVKNLVDCCYKREMASLRPIYCRKLEMCLVCLNDDDMRLSCEECLCRGKIPSGSIYTVSYLIDSDGKDVYDDPNELRNYVTNHLVDVVAETSIIPPKIKMFTEGYVLPEGEPECIPIVLRSIHRDDKKKDFVYRKDRQAISLRRKDRFKEVIDEEIIRLITGVIRGFHPQYDDDKMLISNISKNSNTFFVDLKGVGRCFCRVKDPNGHTHQGNRIYFRISKKDRTITQYCYDDECKQLLANAEVKKRVTSTITGFVFTRIFSIISDDEDCKAAKSFKPVPRHESMNDFLKSFGT